MRFYGVSHFQTNALGRRQIDEDTGYPRVLQEAGTVDSQPPFQSSMSGAPHRAERPRLQRSKSANRVHLARLGAALFSSGSYIARLEAVVPALM